MTRLKSCPFCGSAVKLESKEFNDFAGSWFTNTMSIIECKQCGIAMKRYPERGYGTTEEQKNGLVNAWNRREGEQEEPKQVVRKQCKKEHPDGTIEYYAEWYCPHCGSILKRGYGAEWIKCCFRCGKPVTWEGKQDVERKQDTAD